MSVKVIRIYQLDGIVNAGLELKGGFFEIEVPAGPVAGGYINKRLGVEQLAELLGASPSTDGLSAEQVSAIVEDLLIQGTGITITRTTDGKLEIANSVSAGAVGAIPPEAPTAGDVNDIGDTFSFLPNPAYPSFAQYKVAGLPGVTGAVVLDGTNSYVQGPRIYIKVVGAVAKGGLAVYVAGSGNVPDGQVLTNAEAFTGAVIPPINNTTPDAPFPSYDPVTRVVTFSHALGTSELEYNRFGGTFTAYAPIQVDDAAHAGGEWKARVKAMVGRNASGTADSPAILAKTVANRIPVADAGQDLTVASGTTSVALMGTASDPDPGDTLTYAWRYVTGPNVPTGLPATTLNVVVSNLIAGVYQFGFRSTDNHGAQSVESYVLLTIPAATTPPITGVQPGVTAAGQSNSSGVAQQRRLTASQKGPFPKVRIHNDDTNAEEALQIGVNEAGLNGGLTQQEPRTDGAKIVGQLVNYYDGFGAERRFAELWQANKASNIAYLKLNVEHPTSTDNADLAAWRKTLFANYEREYNRQKANYAAQGKALQITHLLWNQGEADNNNVNYVAELNSLIQQFKDLFGNQDLKIMVVATRGVDNRYAAIRERQIAYVAQEPNATLYDDPNMTYLPQDGIHTDDPSMDRQGEAWYSFVTGTTPPPTSNPGYPISGASLIWSGLNYATRNGSLVKSGSNYSANAGDGFGVNLGLADTYLPANQAGSIKLTLANPKGVGAVLGWHTSTNLTSVFDAAYAFLTQPENNTISVYRAGNAPFTGLAATFSYQYRLNRDSQMIITIQASANGIDWSQPIAKFSQPDSRALYPITDVLAGHELQIPQAEGHVVYGSSGGSTPPTQGVANPAVFAVDATTTNANGYYTTSRRTTLGQVNRYWVIKDWQPVRQASFSRATTGQAAC
jgi:hypothetical protein